MGIRCLTSFIDSYGEKYYTPYRLSSGYVIIDGGIYLDIYDFKTDDDPRFGGDCKKIYDATYATFKRFKDCNLTPIVIVGGQLDERKEATMRGRDEQSLGDIVKYNNNRYRFERIGNTNITFRANAFFEALGDLGILSCRCDFEADGEIVELARKLQCPVVSMDSDFYIYEGITFLHWKKITFDSRANYIDCRKFERSKLLSDFRVSSYALPLLGVFFESDYCKRNLFDDVFPYDRSRYVLKIKTALEWLRNRYSARQELTSIAVEKYGYPVMQEIDFVVNEYTNTRLTISDYIQQHLDLGGKNFNIQTQNLVTKFKVPGELVNLMRGNRLPSTVLEMLTHHRYKTRPMLEKITEKSAYVPSIPLIQNIYGLLMRNEELKPPLKIQIREYGKIVTVEKTATSFPSGPIDGRDTLIQILGVDISTYETAKEFSNGDWAIFILSLTYFYKHCDYAKGNDILSILLTAFVLHISESNEINEDDNLRSCFKTLPESERVRIAGKAAMLDIKKSRNIPLNDISNIHTYQAFQACLFHTKQIFTLLDLPDEFRASVFISGSLFYSFSKALESTADVSDWIRGWFDGNDDIFALYSRLKDALGLDL